MITNVSQRWRDRRGSYKTKGPPVDPHDYDVVAWERDTETKAFVESHHYSGTFPSARYRFHLMHKTRGLVGACVFSHPVNDKTLTNRFPGPALHNTELGRLVILDSEGANAESIFVSRCLKTLRREGIEGVVSFSDPMPRADEDGLVVMPGHAGFCYQALNARYVGRAKANTVRMTRRGTIINNRASGKLRRGEIGKGYVHDDLVELGATPIRPDEDPAAWLKHWIEILTKPVRHPGNYTYLWAVDRRIEKYLAPAQPYPKVIIHPLPSRRKRAK